MMLNSGWDGRSNQQVEEICGSGQFRDINLHRETTFSNSRNETTRGQIENACPTSITQLIKSMDEENSALWTCKEKSGFEISGILNSKQLGTRVKLEKQIDGCKNFR